ncbi:MAG: hypothetical protein IJ520_10225 [Synergistaceae bacterium]|nr:hypothetical protein [Synergistaceae bacterium]MBR1604437.1 hypothetical protein [Synergistaceae bacterium]
MSKISSNKKLLCVLAAAALLLAAGLGCGGSSSHHKRSSSSGSANRAETLYDVSDIADLLTMDMDGDGMPDVLDFEGVAQYHVKNTKYVPFGTAYGLSSLSAAVEKTVTVPSMIWLDRLRVASEDANYFAVQLTAGKEYTFEFSKNLTEFLGGVLPHIKFYDPANAQLKAVDAEEMTAVTIAAYPKEHPSILCYTIKPAVTGKYIIEVSDSKPFAVDAEDEDEDETDSVLFIYEEFRNEDGETGYYTNFKFQDEDGNKSDSISVSDLINLRQLFLQANPKFFEEVYGQSLADDMAGSGSDGDFNFNFKRKRLEQDYARAMYRIQEALGLRLVEEEEPEDEEETDDIIFEPIADEISYTGKVAVARNAAFKAAAIEDQPAKIDTHMDGIPYETQYEIGRGFMATSNFGPIMPQGSIEADITSAWEKANQKYLKKAEEDQHSIQTESYAKFVSTSTQAESLLKAKSTVGLSTAALGMSLGSGTTNNLKFGVTSTNLVIHYEEVENGYRKISAKRIANAWKQQGEDDDDDDDDDDKNKKKGLFAFVENLGKQVGKEKFPEAFRNNLGDYYVAGYQYGACYDAYISIRTETSEQTREVEKKLSAALNLGEGDDQLNASADISNTLKDTFKEYEAQIDVKIVTNGLGHQQPEVVSLDVASNDPRALDKVAYSLNDFIGRVRANKMDRSKYAPIRVKLTRWRNNLTMASTMIAAGDETGLIPVTNGQMGRIARFNTYMKNLIGYKNVVGDNPNVPSAATANVEPEFNEIVAIVKAGGENFYASKDDVERYLKRIEAITPTYRALADRYAFYTLLVRAQAAEKKTYNRLLSGATSSPTGSEQSRKFVREMPFGALEGKSSSGYDSFAYSDYVTEDINAGGPELHKQYYKENNSNFYRRFWYETQKEGDDEYLASAGPAILIAKVVSGDTNDRAVFCKVTVMSLSRNRDTDNLRELTRGSPAVGTSTVGFNFQSGRGDHVDWNIYGKSMRMRQQDYPFKGLQ